MASSTRAADVLGSVVGSPTWTLTARQECDLELLLVGAFDPLDGFLDEASYTAVCATSRLPGGSLWPVPVVLDVPETLARTLRDGQHLALRDAEGSMLAVMTVHDVWRPDRRAEAEAVYGTVNPQHPGVAHLLDDIHPWYVGGTVEGLRLPAHHDFVDLRLTPADVRARARSRGWDTLVAFQTTNPLHRAQIELLRRTQATTGGGLLVHPVIGQTKPGDIDHYIKTRCYRAALRHLPEDGAMLALLPLAIRTAGPREALWQALIRRNYGATHLMIGRDHADPGAADDRTPFYPPHAAQDLVHAHEEETGVTCVPFRELVYDPGRDTYVTEDEVTPHTRHLSLSETQQRQLLRAGGQLPAWFSPPEIAAEMRRAFKPRAEQGFTLFFTGLPTSGKSTLAKAVRARLLEDGHRTVTMLDGDIVRTYLSSELTFSREHRDLNIRRVAYVAAEVSKHGGIALCAAIAPFAAARDEARRLVEQHGAFILVSLSASVDACEARDHKGNYAKARAGTITRFTGVSDVYEMPENAELVINTADVDVATATRTIIGYLRDQGFLPGP